MKLSINPILAWFTLGLVVAGSRWPREWPDGDQVALRERMSLLLIFAAPGAMLLWGASFIGADHARRDELLTWRRVVLMSIGIVHLLLTGRVLFIHRRWPFVA